MCFGMVVLEQQRYARRVAAESTVHARIPARKPRGFQPDMVGLISRRLRERRGVLLYRQ